jgi:hypothetical protein
MPIESGENLVRQRAERGEAKIFFANLDEIYAALDPTGD